MHKSSKRYGIVLYVMMLVSIILISILTDSLVVRSLTIISGLLALGSGGALYLLMKQSERKQTEQIDKFLYVLQRKRHDLMNGIQIIYGYSKLNKHERVLENIEALSEHLKQESNISKLEDAKLEWFFHEFSAKTLKFQFELELQEEMKLSELHFDRSLLYDAVSQTALLIEQAAAFSELEEPHYLTVQMDILNENIFVTFHYDGIYDENMVRSELENIRRKVGKTEGLQLNSQYSPDHLFIEIKLPYRK